MQSSLRDISMLFGAPEADRLAAWRGDETWLAASLGAPDTRFLPVCGDDSAVRWEGETPHPLLLTHAEAQEFLPQAQCVVLLGRVGGHTCFALGLVAEALPENQRRNLRKLFPLLPAGEVALLGYARAMVYWHGRHRYCGACGRPTVSRRGGHERRCENCGTESYPRLDPAIIVLVTHGERCLLGRQAAWPEHQFSTLAGFVEPGETLEAAVAREVLEETNIQVQAPIYRHSQPWPFPSSLMLGFRAEAGTTDIHCNDGELAEARWFSREDIVGEAKSGKPVLPPSLSISFLLIREWFEAHPDYSIARLAERNPGVFRA